MKTSIFVHNNSPRFELGRREKTSLNFYFYFGASKALKAFIKPFEAPQRSVKIKIYIIFHFKKTF